LLRPADADRICGRDDGIAHEEHEDIMTVPMTLDGYTGYTDAVFRIAKEGSDVQAES